jgi:hypothetical protein
MRYNSQAIHLFRHGLDLFMSGVWDSIQLVALACSCAIFRKGLSPLCRRRIGEGQANTAMCRA